MNIPTVLTGLLDAIEEVDLARLRTLCSPEVLLRVPGSMTADITSNAEGIDAFCAWTTSIRKLCGVVRISPEKVLREGDELMCVGTIWIERSPRDFRSPCSLSVSFKDSKIASFFLLLDTFALEQFRGD